MPDVPSAEELSVLPAAGLAARLAEAYRLTGELTAQVELLSAQVEDLRRQARRDSSTSSRPPSSDSPYKKGSKDRSLRERGKRRPGKQPGEPGATMKLIDDPDERFEYPPAACAGCGADLAVGHHIPIWRSTVLLCQLVGIAVSTGWMAGIRGKAAALIEDSGFMDRVRDLLKAAPAVHADETPARAAAGTQYVHLACTAYLACMHTGDRSAEAIDADGADNPAGQGPAALFRGLLAHPRRTRRLRRCPVLPLHRQMGHHQIDALRGLFNGTPWMPPGIEPTG